MANKQEDLLFKDVGEEEIEVLLKRIKIKSKKKKLNPTEIRFIDANVLIADIIIELDEIILIIEFQSTIVDTNDKDRFLAYFSMVNFKKLHGFIKGFPGIMTKLSGIFSKVGTAISGISAPILIAVAVIAVLVAAFKHLWDTNEDFRNKMISIWDGIVEKVTSFVETVKSKFAALDSEKYLGRIL